MANTVGAKNGEIVRLIGHDHFIRNRFKFLQFISGSTMQMLALPRDVRTETARSDAASPSDSASAQHGPTSPCSLAIPAVPNWRKQHFLSSPCSGYSRGFTFSLSKF
jgi:hypothetical protein